MFSYNDEEFNGGREKAYLDISGKLDMINMVLKDLG